LKAQSPEFKHQYHHKKKKKKAMKGEMHLALQQFHARGRGVGVRWWSGSSSTSSRIVECLPSTLLLTSNPSPTKKKKKERKRKIECGVHSCNPVLRRLKQEDCKFEVSVDYIVRPCLKKKVISAQKESSRQNKQDKDLSTKSES
jgi:hypothetical protein